MCGIVACLNKQSEDERSNTNHNNSVIEFLLQGLQRLQNRGYDSAGIAVWDSEGSQFLISKHCSQEAIQDEWKNVKCNSNIGIAHTRWATHGSKSLENAHPISDCSMNIVFIVHNGIIENEKELRNKFLPEAPWKTQTDTEVIAELIASFLIKGSDLKTSVQKTQDLLQGSWAIVAVSPLFPSSLVVAKNKSPLLVSWDNNKMIYVASETSAFESIVSCSKYVSLEDNDCFDLSTDMGTLLNNPKMQVHQIDCHSLTNKNGFKHWTLKEIMEQSYVIESFLKDKNVKSESSNNFLSSDIHFIGCGSSFYACNFVSRVISSPHVHIHDACDYIDERLIASDDLLVFVSQSGETKDLIDCMKRFPKQKKLCFVNVSNSTIGRIIGHENEIILHWAGREVGVAATKSFMIQCVALLRFFMDMEREGSLYLGSLHSGSLCSGSLHPVPLHPVSFQLEALPLNIDQTLKQNETSTLEEQMTHIHSCFIVGRGIFEPIAKEAALKLKEIAYIHAEAMSTGSLKHGPLALIDSSTFVFVITTEMDEPIIHQVRSRNGKVFVLTNNSNHKGFLDVTNPICFALCSVVWFQMLAYKVSVKKGINPDQPRNLAKTVTVS